MHGTNDLRVENNVTYNSVGHCFFLEDGIEHGNEFVHNLGILTKCHTSKPCIGTNLAASGETAACAGRQIGQQSKEVLIPSDSTVSMFWITNPDNIYRDNVAAGAEQIGFWLAFPEHPNGAFQDTDIQQGHLDAPHAVPRVQGQHRPLELRWVDVSTADIDANEHFQCYRQPAHGLCANPADSEQQAAGIRLRGFHRLQEPQWRHLGPR